MPQNSDNFVPVKWTFWFYSFGFQVTDVVIAEQSDFVASFSSLDQILKVWSVAEKGLEIFQIKLKVRVEQMHFSADSRHLVVLGRKPSGRKKVLLFMVKPASCVRRKTSDDRTGAKL